MDTPATPTDRWNTRYASSEEFLFGEAPNDYLRSQIQLIPPGSDVLCVADGEGRNGVFLAEHGHRVTSVDLSSVALARAEALAHERGVRLTTVVADLTDFDLGQDQWDAIVSIFAHLPGKVRAAMHRQVMNALRPGGVFILEAYHPDQVERATGGPSSRKFLASVGALKEELAGLGVVHENETERSVTEGSAHSGAALVVQFTARRAVSGSGG